MDITLVFAIFFLALWLTLWLASSSTTFLGVSLKYAHKMSFYCSVGFFAYYAKSTEKYGWLAVVLLLAITQLISKGKK